MSRCRIAVRVTPQRMSLCPVILAMFLGAGCVESAQSRQTVVLKPGQDIAAIAAGSPEGTQFRFEPGVYRQQAIRPRDRQRFVGQPGVILNGAMELTAWTAEAGLWQSEQLPPPLRCAHDGRISFSMVACTSASRRGTDSARRDGTTRTIGPI